MKRIKLTNKQFALVDDEDFDYLNQWKWYAHYDPHTKSYRAVCSLPRTKGHSQQRLQMSRLIANTPKGLICDHINHNTLDNRKINLRNITNSENSMNRRVQSNNKLGITGVSFNQGKYHARITKNRKTYHLGSFQSLNDAKIAYENAAKELFGEMKINECYK